MRRPKFRKRLLQLISINVIALNRYPSPDNGVVDRLKLKIIGTFSLLVNIAGIKYIISLLSTKTFQPIVWGKY